MVINNNIFKGATSALLTRVFVTLAILLLPITSWAISSITASVDRNPALVGETFYLTIKAQSDHKMNLGALDLEPLKAQFSIASVTMSTQHTSNAVNLYTENLKIGLQSYQPGSHTIPSFTIAGVTSQPISVDIIQQQLSQQQQSEIQIQASVSDKSTYVGAPITYEIKLLIATRLQRAQLNPPVLAGADIVPLGEDLDSQEIIDGKRFRIITRRYLITPRQAGSLTLQGALFTGDTNPSGYGRSTPITLVADDHVIEIKPISANFPGQWLASNMVVIEDDWSQEGPYQVGEPITRTITLSATNINSAQLPKLTIDNGNALQSYPDKATLKEGLNEATLIAQSVQKIALIPIKAGTITVPAIKIPWFNLETEQVEWAIIKSRTLDVIPSAVTPTPAPQQAQAPQPQPLTATEESNHPHWAVNVSIVINVVLALALVCAVIIIVYQRRVYSANSANTQLIVPDSDHYQSLLLALKNQQVNQILRVLPLWLKHDFNCTIDDPLIQEFSLSQHYHQLAKNHFSQDQQPVDYQGLKQAVRQLSAHMAQTSKQDINRLYQ